AVICYPLLFAICNVLLLPGGILAVGGGFFFGLWWGFLIVFVGNIIGTVISFTLSRSIARRWFQQKLSSNPTLRALGPALERESWKVMLLRQLHRLQPITILPSRSKVSRKLNPTPDVTARMGWPARG